MTGTRALSSNVNFRSQGDDLAGRRHHQRINFTQGRVLFQKNFADGVHDLLGRRHLFGREAEFKRQPAGLMRLQPHSGDTGTLRIFSGELGGDFFISTPPSAEAMSTGTPLARSSTMPR